MSKVKVEFLSWLVETLGFERTSKEFILEAEIEPDKTVRDLLGQLAGKYPRFGQLVFDVKSQNLTDRVSIFLNSRHLELMNGLETKLKDGDILTLVEPIAGG